ncbi:MAG: hypothetical protein ABL995_08460 [Bryobacteraceae bacterium]
MNWNTLLLTAGLFACVVAAQPVSRMHLLEVEPDGRGNRPIDFVDDRPAALTAATAAPNGITYHNGPVMTGTTHIYYIWYGDWSTDATAPAILNNFANKIGGSPYYNINTTYTNSAKTAVSNAVTLAGSVTDTSTKTSLSDADIWSIVVRSFGNGFPVDPNGVYFVLTAPGVKATSGFLTAYCGWHTYNVYNGVTVKYSFVGNAKGPSLRSCAAQTTGSPNNDPAADGMVSVLAHELEETVTDPQLNAWYDANGNENADKCSWTFGTAYAAGGGAANMKLGTMDYLIQRNWVNANGGSCALSYTGSPDYGLIVSPGSQTVAQGAKSGNYTINVSTSNGFSGSVSFTVSGLPAGATLSPAPAATKTSATFAVLASATAAAGTYTLTINGTSGTLKHSTTTTLVITSNKTYTISVTPSLLNVKRGNTGQFSVAVVSKGGFNSPVKLTVTGLPERTTGTITTTTINGAGSTTLKVTPASNSVLGAYTLIVTGTSGAMVMNGSTTLVLQ